MAPRIRVAPVASATRDRWPPKQFGISRALCRARCLSYQMDSGLLKPGRDHRWARGTCQWMSTTKANGYSIAPRVFPLCLTRGTENACR